MSVPPNMMMPQQPQTPQGGGQPQADPGVFFQQINGLIARLMGPEDQAQQAIELAVRMGIRPPAVQSPEAMMAALGGMGNQPHQRPQQQMTNGPATPFMPMDPQATLGQLLSGGK